MPCEQCGRPFDPIRFRWLCPWCRFKNSCCQGAPLAPLRTERRLTRYLVNSLEDVEEVLAVTTHVGGV